MGVRTGTPEIVEGVKALRGFFVSRPLLGKAMQFTGFYFQVIDQLRVSPLGRVICLIGICKHSVNTIFHLKFLSDTHIRDIRTTISRGNVF